MAALLRPSSACWFSGQPEIHPEFMHRMRGSPSATPASLGYLLILPRRQLPLPIFLGSLARKTTAFLSVLATHAALLTCGLLSGKKTGEKNWEIHPVPVVTVKSVCFYSPEFSVVVFCILPEVHSCNLWEGRSGEGLHCHIRNEFLPAFFT